MKCYLYAPHVYQLRGISSTGLSPWPPADRKSKWKNLGPHDAIPRLPHHQRGKFQAHDTHLLSTRGQPASHFLTARSCVPAVNVTRNWLGIYFFFLCTWDYKTVFLCCRWQPAARYSSNWKSGLLKVQPEAQPHCYWSSFVGSCRMKRLHVVAASADHKTSNKAIHNFIFVVYQCEKMSCLSHATVKILVSVMCRKKYCDMWIQ